MNIYLKALTVAIVLGFSIYCLVKRGEGIHYKTGNVPMSILSQILLPVCLLAIAFEKEILMAVSLPLFFFSGLWDLIKWRRNGRGTTNG